MVVQPVPNGFGGYSILLNLDILNSKSVIELVADVVGEFVESIEKDTAGSEKRY